MKTVRAVFKNGVFVPVEPCSPPEGCEAVVVFVDKREKELPKWWNSIDVKEEKKRALLDFVSLLRRRVSPIDVKAVVSDGGLEVFVITDDSERDLRTVMEEALKVYERSSVYLPVQVISSNRLERWREQGSSIYKQIEKGVSLL
ncbi:MAG: antitoxin AF2212-like protein [Desulfurobacteriaceae bacterium]